MPRSEERNRLPSSATSSSSAYSGLPNRTEHYRFRAEGCPVEWVISWSRVRVKDSSDRNVPRGAIRMQSLPGEYAAMPVYRLDSLTGQLEERIRFSAIPAV